MIQVWSFDPGLATGWTHLSVDDDGEVGSFFCGETDHLGIGNLIYENLHLELAMMRDVIDLNFVAEKFVMNSKVSPSPWSLETTGLIRYFADRHRIPFHIQTPSAVKNLIKNDVIKRAGLWVPSDGGHQMDAVRHALYFLIVKKGVLKECLKSL